MKSSIKRKNFYLDEAKLNKARKLLHTKTATDTIHEALDLVVFGKEIMASLDQVKGKGKGHLIHPHR